MSSFEVEFFEKVPNPDYLCPICCSVFDSPLQCPCKHVFCKVCIETWLSKQTTCPTCRKDVRKARLKPAAKKLQTTLNRLAMKCPNKQHGCKVVLAMPTYADHLKSCVFEQVKCKYMKCQKMVLRKHLRRHEGHGCEFRELACPRECGLMVLWNEVKSHNCIDTLKKRVEDLLGQVKEYETNYTEIKKTTTELQSQVKDLKKKIETRRRRRYDFLYSDDDLDSMSDDSSVGTEYTVNDSDASEFALSDVGDAGDFGLFDTIMSIFDNTRSENSSSREEPENRQNDFDSSSLFSDFRLRERNGVFGSSDEEEEETNHDSSTSTALPSLLGNALNAAAKNSSISTNTSREKASGLCLDSGASTSSVSDVQSRKRKAQKALISSDESSDEDTPSRPPSRRGLTTQNGRLSRKNGTATTTKTKPQAKLCKSPISSDSEEDVVEVEQKTSASNQYGLRQRKKNEDSHCLTSGNGGKGKGKNRSETGTKAKGEVPPRLMSGPVSKRGATECQLNEAVPLKQAKKGLSVEVFPSTSSSSTDMPIRSQKKSESSTQKRNRNAVKRNVASQPAANSKGTKAAVGRTRAAPLCSSDSSDSDEESTSKLPIVLRTKKNQPVTDHPRKCSSNGRKVVKSGSVAQTSGSTATSSDEEVANGPKLKKGTRKAAAVCLSKTAEVLAGEETDDSWSPGGTVQPSDVSISDEETELECDWDTPVPVPKSVSQLLDEVADEEDEEEWVPH